MVGSLSNLLRVAFHSDAGTTASAICDNLFWSLVVMFLESCVPGTSSWVVFFNFSIFQLTVVCLLYLLQNFQLLLENLTFHSGLIHIGNLDESPYFT